MLSIWKSMGHGEAYKTSWQINAALYTARDGYLPDLPFAATFARMLWQMYAFGQQLLLFPRRGSLHIALIILIFYLSVIDSQWWAHKSDTWSSTIPL